MSSFLNKKFVLIILSFVFCLLIIYPFLFPFLLALVVAYLCEEPVNRISKFIKREGVLWRWFISLMFILFIFFIFVFPFCFILIDSIGQISSMISKSSFSIKDIGFYNDKIHESISMVLDKFGVHFVLDDLILKVKMWLETFANVTFREFAKIIYSTPQTLIKFVIFFITAIVFIVHGQKYRKLVLPKLIPWPDIRKLLSKSTSNVLSALIVANLLVATIQAVFITAVLGVLTVPRFAVLGFISFFMSFIPVVGTAPIMLGSAAYLFFGEHRLIAAVVVVIASVVVGLLDNLLRPYFMKSKSNLNFFWVFLAVIGGLSQFGLIGTILGPLAFSLFYGILSSRSSLSSK